MTEADIERAAQLYLDYMPYSFFNTLGRGFVEFLLRGITLSKHGSSYVCVEDGKVAGFIAATSDKRGLFKELAARHGLALCGFCLRGVVRDPRAALNILETACYGLRKTGPSDARAEFLFVAIDPARRRQGACTALIEAVLAEFRKNGIDKVKVSVLKDNHGVNVLLEQMGFKFRGPFRLYKKEMLSYESMI